ncbi:MAG TPA: hypothetical protein VFZ53_27125, partial [Polyangiaceae bacterium]
DVDDRRTVVPSAPPAGGWAFGRDGATLSVPIERPRPLDRARRRWVGVLAAAVGIGGGMLLLSPERRGEPTAAVPPMPRLDGSATKALPTAAPTPRAVERESVAATAKPAPSVEREPPIAKARRPKHGTPSTASSVQPVASPASDVPPASSVAGPSPAKHVHPVFGLEVEAQH